MVEPVGYVKDWQKFENQVYNVVKKFFQDNDNFIVEWSPVVEKYCNEKMKKLTPDVLVSFRCKSCREHKRLSCTEPAFIFEAHCKYVDDPEYFRKKDEQMRNYSFICDSILVMPKGYEERAFCRTIDKKYHIISFEFLHRFLKSLKQAVEITYQEDCCGNRPSINAQHVYRDFELSLRQSVDKCPNCKQRVEPISLLYCSQYDEFSDIDHIEDYCCDCSNRIYHDECPFLSLQSKYQCRTCGVVFDPEAGKLIENFDEGFYDRILSDYSYYKKKREES